MILIDLADSVLHSLYLPEEREEPQVLHHYFLWEEGRQWLGNYIVQGERVPPIFCRLGLALVHVQAINEFWLQMLNI